VTCVFCLIISSLKKEKYFDVDDEISTSLKIGGTSSSLFSLPVENRKGDFQAAESGL